MPKRRRIKPVDPIIAKSRIIEKDLRKKYKLKPFLYGSLATETNIPGTSDYDYGMVTSSRERFEALKRRMSQDMRGSIRNKPNQNMYTYHSEVKGEPVDLTLFYGPEGDMVRWTTQEARERMSAERKREIIKKKQDIKSSFFFPKTRYYRYKDQLREEMGVFAPKRRTLTKAAKLDPKWQLTRSDVYGHRTSNLDSVIKSNALLSAAEAGRRGLLKDYEADRWARDRSAPAAGKELRSEVFLTRKLLPPSATYGKYGVLVRSGRAKPSAYLNMVPGEHVVDSQVRGRLTYVVPDDEYRKWKNKYRDARFIRESEVPAEKITSDASSLLEVPMRILRGAKLSHKTEKVVPKTKVAEPLTIAALAAGLHVAANTAVKLTHNTKPLRKLRRNLLAKGIREGLEGTALTLRQNLARTWGSPEIMESHALGRFIGDNLRAIPERKRYSALKQLRKAVAQYPNGLQGVPHFEDTVGAINKVLESPLPKPKTIKEMSLAAKAAPVAVAPLLGAVEPSLVLHGALNQGRLAAANSRLGRLYLTDEFKAGLLTNPDTVAELRDLAKGLSAVRGLAPKKLEGLLPESVEVSRTLPSPVSEAATDYLLSPAARDTKRIGEFFSNEWASKSNGKIDKLIGALQPVLRKSK